jgi:4-amino-4-deoxy-L-arabinose transferase-like glycosyltransferase
MVELLVLPQRAKQWFLAALGVAVTIRLYLLWQYYCITSDGVVYLRAADDFYRGDFDAALSSVYPPGYPLLVAAVYPLIGDWELAGQLLSLLFGVLLLFPLYWIFREVFGEGPALIACFLAAISPFLALYSVHVRSESTYLFLSALAVYLFLSAIETQRVWSWFWGGVVAGYAYLVRPEAIGFLILIPAVALLCWLSQKRIDLSHWATTFALLSFGFLLFSLPYVVYLSGDTGRFGAISRKAGITLAINLKESGALEEGDLQQDADLDSFVFTDYVRQHPIRYLKQVALSAIPALGVYFEALYYAYVPFLLLGIFVALRNKAWTKPELLLVGFALFYVFGFALIYVKRRYALQAVPISLGWVAVGMVYTWKKLRTNFADRKATVLAVSLGMIFLGSTLAKTLKPVSREKAYVREAGWYLKTQNRTGDLKVAVFDERVTFYASAKTVSLTTVEQAELSDELRKRQAHYLAVETRTLQRAYPETARRPDLYGLALERTFVGKRNDKMLLFKVL